MTEQTNDIVAQAEERGAFFQHNENRGWYWGWLSSPAMINRPCETQEEAAREFLEANAPDEDADAEPNASERQAPGL